MVRRVFENGKDLSRIRWPRGTAGQGWRRCGPPPAHAQGCRGVGTASSWMPLMVCEAEWDKWW